jgi:hypothetical protein
MTSPGEPAFGDRAHGPEGRGGGGDETAAVPEARPVPAAQVEP